MPDWRVPVFVEGDVDRAVLNGLRAAGLLSDRLELPVRKPGPTGKDQVFRELAGMIAIPLRAIALLDYDEHTSADSFAALVRKRIGEELGKVGHTSACEVRVVGGAFLELGPAQGVGAYVIPVGASLPLDGFAPKSRAMDDYLVSLALEPDTYDGLRAKDRALVEHPHVMKKLTEVLALLDANGIPVQDSKRLCLLLRGLAGFHAAQATFAERLLKGAHAIDATRLKQRFAPLLGALDAALAAMLLTAAPDVPAT